MSNAKLPEPFTVFLILGVLGGVRIFADGVATPLGTLILVGGMTALYGWFYGRNQKGGQS